jgi:protein required for attachment to host cells
MRQKRTWVLVADGGRACIFENEASGAGLIAIPDGVLEAEPYRTLTPSSEIGRSFESVGTMRHGIEPRITPREKMERRFIGEIIDKLEAGRKIGAFDRLIVIAEPKALGEFRRQSPEALSALIVETSSKDLAHVAKSRLEREVGLGPRS